MQQDSNPWHEQDVFWETTGPTMFTAQRWANAPAEVASLLKLLGLEPGAAVLDLGCGVGRHSLELVRRGFLVTGVDRTARFLDEARKRADAESLKIELVEEDMRAFA